MKLEKYELNINGVSVEIPYFVINGKKDGPSGFISGGLHGNEINGISTVKKFLKFCEKNEIENTLSGSLTVIPVLNTSGFKTMQRYVAEDQKDLNRCFGFENPSSFSEILANDLAKNLLSKHDFGIDIHDAGGKAALMPHSRVHISDETDCFECSTYMGRLLGTKIIVSREGNPHMLATYMNSEYEVPVLTVEAGGAQKSFPDYHQELLQGINNVLIYFNMLEGEIKIPKKQFFLRDRYGLKAKEACEIEFSVELGDSVHVGDVLGNMYFPNRNETQEIKSTMCGFIFSLWQFNQAPEGQRLYSILEDKDCHIKRSTLDDFAELEHFKKYKIKM